MLEITSSCTKTRSLQGIAQHTSAIGHGLLPKQFSGRKLMALRAGLGYQTGRLVNLYSLTFGNM